jgi:3-hydroxypropionyl-CoA synthetase (ADP-forming)
LQAAYPPYYVVQNPVDVTGSASSDDYRAGVEALLADSRIDVVMPWFVLQDTPLDEGIVQVLAELSQESTKPILCGAMGGPYSETISSMIEAKGVPVFQGVRQWLAAAHAVSCRASRGLR